MLAASYVPRRARRTRDTAEHRQRRAPVRGDADAAARGGRGGLPSGRPRRAPRRARLLARGGVAPPPRPRSLNTRAARRASSLPDDEGRDLLRRLAIRRRRLSRLRPRDTGLARRAPTRE